MKARRMQKLLAISLAVVLVVGLAACSGSSGNNTTPTDAPAAAKTDAPAVSDTTVATEEPVPVEEDDSLAVLSAKNMEGRNFRFACWWDYITILPDAAEPDPETAGDYARDMMHYENAMRVYEDYNCTFSNVTVTFEETPNLLATSVMAGDPAGDLFVMDGSWLLNAIIGNLIIPFNDFLPADHDVFTAQQRVKPVGVLQDKTWSVRNAEDAVWDGGATFLGVNMDIIKAIGAENPAELYDRGEWTWDKFMEILRLATKDTNGDGVIDQYGISGQANDIMVNLIASNGGSMVTEDLNYGFDQPKTMAAIELCNQIFGVDKTWNYDPNSGAEFWDWNRNTHAFEEGRTALFVAWPWLLPDNPDARTFEYSAVPFPKGPSYDGHTYDTGFSQCVVIPRGAKNPADTFEVLEQHWNWYADDYELRDDILSNWQVGRFMAEEDALRIAKNAQTGGLVDLGNAVSVDGRGYSWDMGDFCMGFYNGTATPAQIVEEKRQAEQDMLDTVFSSFK